jgi:hypothetical protein
MNIPIYPNEIWQLFISLPLIGKINFIILSACAIWLCIRIWQVSQIRAIA